MEPQIKNWTYTIPALVILSVGFLLVIPTFWGGILDLVYRWDSQEEYGFVNEFCLQGC
jgi:hypothetical protein